jgi:enoyl-CoA hydratase
MSDINIRVSGRAGRITLTRPKALNALTYEMCMAIDAAVDQWRDDPAVALIVIDAEGERAFCSGGDIAELYATGTKGDYSYGRRFWADEYRLNHKLFSYPKPVVSFLHGFTMGGGVGIGCHGTHRIVGESSQIAMPECGIGLVPDVGGSRLLAQAPGRLGAYLGTTGSRMKAADAIHAGFADLFIPQDAWSDLIAQLEQSGDTDCLRAAATDAEPGTLADASAEIDRLFASSDFAEVIGALESAETDLAEATLKALRRAAPLSAACTLAILDRLSGAPATMEAALDLEYRFTYRAMEHGDFLEGIRAAIIDKDRNPRWQFAEGAVPQEAIEKMLAPLGADALTLEEQA